MTGKQCLIASVVAVVALSTSNGRLHAQQKLQPQFPNMTFFITSTGGPRGADFGGVEGADKHCQALAAKAGAGARTTWRAYLSVQPNNRAKAVNARDRIGKGPWVNALGQQIAANVDDLHSANNKINQETGYSETGRLIPGRDFVVNQHDIFTGTLADGTAPPAGEDLTCGNWTKSDEGSALVGHFDLAGGFGGTALKSWNSSHATRGCGLAAMKGTSAGLIYCFAAN